MLLSLASITLYNLPDNLCVSSSLCIKPAPACIQQNALLLEDTPVWQNMVLPVFLAAILPDTPFDLQDEMVPYRPRCKCL